MNSVTRRWWLLAMAGAPIVVGLTAQPLSVRLDNDYFRVSAPNLDFLKDKPLERLMDGNTVGYLGQLTVLSGRDRAVQVFSIAHFAFSYDIWAERFKVTLVTPQLHTHPSAKNLTRVEAQAWCLEQLKIDLSRVPADSPIWVRLEIRSEDPRDTAGIVGESGINLISGLIEIFSRPVKPQQVRVAEEIGPLKVDDLRKRHL